MKNSPKSYVNFGCFKLVGLVHCRVRAGTGAAEAVSKFLPGAMLMRLCNTICYYT
jgi:hypothetical protein